MTQALNNGNNFWRQRDAQFTISQISINRSRRFRVTMFKVVQITP